MDESWRIPMGTLIPRRRSTGESTKVLPSAGTGAGTDISLLDSEDFGDVFGGPPRTALLRQFSSGDVTPAGVPYLRASFNEDAFLESELGFPPRNGCTFPNFPTTTTTALRVRTEEGFFDDIFGSDGGGCSGSGDRGSWTTSWKSKSKSNSSSVLSSEDLSPLHPFIAEDPALCSFASKLRPITIPSRLNSSSPKFASREKPRNHQNSFVAHSPNVDFQIDSNRFKSFFQPQYTSPPESITLDPASYQNIKMSFDDSDVESPLSVMSSPYQIPMATIIRNQDKDLKELEKEVIAMLEGGGGEEEAECSYVIEIAPDGRTELEGATAMEEAIAWAAEKFRVQSPKEVEVGDEHHHDSEVEIILNKEVGPFAQREECNFYGD